MKNNVKIAKQLIKLAKSLVAESDYLFPEYHDVQVQHCYMSLWFDEETFHQNYEEINNYNDGTYLYGKLKGKEPRDIFDMSNEPQLDKYYGGNWKQFFSEISENLNNAVRQISLKPGYSYYIAKGYLQGDSTQIIYDKSEVHNVKMFDEFLYDHYLDINIIIDGEQYSGYDLLYDLSYYDKETVINKIKQKFGNDFSEDLRNQLEEKLPENSEISCE